MKSVFRLCLLLLFFLSTLGFAGNLPSLKGQPALKHPIVLVHGATMGGAVLKVGPLTFGDYFRRIPEFYAETNTPVKVAQLTTDSSIGERAAILGDFLRIEFPGQKVNLICHSLGGLDARYLAAVLKNQQIASITTIGTPHRGASLADWGENVATQRGFWYWLFRLFGYDMRGRRFLPELTTKFMRDTFNIKAPDRKDVQYFSLRSSASYSKGNLSYLFWLPVRWIRSMHNGEDVPNDGLVELDSQGWGQDLGTYELDHLGQMNHHEMRKPMEKQSLELYERVYANLREKGL